MTPPYSCLVEHKYAFIVDVIVEKSYQSKGIGSALLDAAKNGQPIVTWIIWS